MAELEGGDSSEPEAGLFVNVYPGLSIYSGTIHGRFLILKTSKDFSFCGEFPSVLLGEFKFLLIGIVRVSND